MRFLLECQPYFFGHPISVSDRRFIPSLLNLNGHVRISSTQVLLIKASPIVE